MKLKYALILLLPLIFTGFTVFDNLSTYKMAKQSSEDLLKSTAYFIGLTLGQALNRIDMDEELFLDLIKEQTWEEIAFIALYDKDGKILLHSSKRLIGKSTEAPWINEVIQKAKPLSSYIKLKTGEIVYVMDIPIHIHARSPSIHLLRIALHTYPSRSAIRHTKIHNFTSMIFVALMWILALSFLHYSRKIDELQRKEIEKRHLTMLGEMAAVLAHEIRSPLSAIKGFAQYILEKTKKDSSTEEGLGVIIDESKRLERLTEDLLIFARTSDIRPEYFSLSELIKDVEGLFISDGKNITIT
jgi:two-component system sensor histidine kinase HydH